MGRSRRVVITGMGLVTPVGETVSETWNAVRAGVSGIGVISRFDATTFPVRIAGEAGPAINFDELPDANALNHGAALGLTAAREAIDNSHPETWPEDRSRVGVFLGCGRPGPSFQSVAHLLLQQPARAREALGLEPGRNRNFDAGSAAIADLADAHGPNVSIYTACSSGAQAVGEAANSIRRGQTDVVIAGGYDSMINELSMIAFSRLGVLADANDEPELASRPFDRDRNGLVMGEGAGILILEDLNHAVARGVDILAEVSGFGISMNGYRVTDPDPEAKGPVAAIESALLDADIGPSEIGYVNAHGTGTWANDPLETLALRKAFGVSADDLAISSTKSMTGHLMAAAGAVESVISVQALREQMAPPTINLENPDPRCDLDYVPRQARRFSSNHVLNNAFGFGGVNVSLVFSRRETVVDLS